MSDSREFTDKRVDAILLLQEYTKWYLLDQSGQLSETGKLVYCALTKNILEHTEAALDEMITDITKQINQATMHEYSSMTPLDQPNHHIDTTSDQIQQLAIDITAVCNQIATTKMPFAGNWPFQEPFYYNRYFTNRLKILVAHSNIPELEFLLHHAKVRLESMTMKKLQSDIT